LTPNAKRKPARAAADAEVEYPASESIGYLMRITLRGIRSMLRANLRKEGIDLGIWFYLRVLWEEDGITQKVLTQRVGDAQPSSVKALRALEQSGLVTLERDADDKRKMRISLTAKGRGLKRKLLHSAVHINEEVALAGFKREETLQLRAFLRRIRENVATLGDS
jgi:MarR family transcriptional regulator, organic hydroperoxide resistance regulator